MVKCLASYLMCILFVSDTSDSIRQSAAFATAAEGASMVVGRGYFIEDYADVSLLTISLL